MNDCVTFALARAAQLVGAAVPPDPRENAGLMQALSLGRASEWLPGWRQLTEREPLENGDIVLLRSLRGGQHLGVYEAGLVVHWSHGQEQRIEASRIRRVILGVWRCVV